MKDTRNEDVAPLAHEFSKNAPRLLTVDVERYQAYLDGSGMSDAEREEFLQALWSIILNFVDLGFGVHPLQEVCAPEDGKDSGQQQETAAGADAGSPSGLEVK